MSAACFRRLCRAVRGREGHGDWKPVHLTASHRSTRCPRLVCLSHELTVAPVKARNRVASSSVAVRLPSLSAAGCRFTFAVATPRPRGAAVGRVFLRCGRRHAGAHCGEFRRSSLRHWFAVGLRHPPLVAVLVPAAAAGDVGRFTLAGAESFGSGGAAASAMASVLVPSVASPATRFAARSRSQQPNLAVNRTPRRQCLLRWWVAPIVGSPASCRGAGRRLPPR